MKRGRREREGERCDSPVNLVDTPTPFLTDCRSIRLSLSTFIERVLRIVNPKSTKRVIVNERGSIVFGNDRTVTSRRRWTSFDRGVTRVIATISTSRIITATSVTTRVILFDDEEIDGDDYSSDNGNEEEGDKAPNETFLLGRFGSWCGEEVLLFAGGLWEEWKLLEMLSYVWIVLLLVKKDSTPVRCRCRCRCFVASFESRAMFGGSQLVGLVGLVVRVAVDESLTL